MSTPLERCRVDFTFPSLRPDRLSSVIPTQVYAGSVSIEPALFLWRTYALAQACGMTLAFYLQDEKLEPLWRHPDHYADVFLRAGVASVLEVDFSLWRDAPLVEQLWNTYRSRCLAR